MAEDNLPRAGPARKPSAFLKLAESHAKKLRRLLQQWKGRFGSCEHSASTDDALALAELVEYMASYGQRCRAADAIDIAERVERLLDLLVAEVDGLLASES